MAFVNWIAVGLALLNELFGTTLGSSFLSGFLGFALVCSFLSCSVSSALSCKLFNILPPSSDFLSALGSSFFSTLGKLALRGVQHQPLFDGSLAISRSAAVSSSCPATINSNAVELSLGLGVSLLNFLKSLLVGLTSFDCLAGNLANRRLGTLGGHHLLCCELCHGVTFLAMLLWLTAEVNIYTQALRLKAG